MNELYHSNHIYREEYLPIYKAWHEDEELLVAHILEDIHLSPEEASRIQSTARKIIESIRVQHRLDGPLDAMLLEYELSTQEGVALMCLSEALMRIPDKGNQDDLIRDKLTNAKWMNPSGKSESWVANAATWGLMFTGKLLDDQEARSSVLGNIKKLISRMGEPMIRTMIKRIIEQLGNKFVLGESIEQAKARSIALEQKGYWFSYDMLGEAALTRKDADFFFQQYKHAIASLNTDKNKPIITSDGVSIKLSAICPFFEPMHARRAVDYLAGRLIELVSLARSHHVCLCVDAEETARLPMSLQVIEKVLDSSACQGWQGFGMAVQAYQKCAKEVLLWLVQTLREKKSFMSVRLVKGAYWDSEIKEAQVLGLDYYPVFTQKHHTDCMYLSCAKVLLAARDVIYPQFASHNAFTVASILEWVDECGSYEFQCLHGMGSALYDMVLLEWGGSKRVRMYAPVGEYKDLLPYLVRRILENGANSSFVNQLIDKSLNISDIIRAPQALLAQEGIYANPAIPLPRQLFPDGRENSKGYWLANDRELQSLIQKMNVQQLMGKVGPITSVTHECSEPICLTSPIDRQLTLGSLRKIKKEMVDPILALGDRAFGEWQAIDLDARCDILEAAADLLEKETALMLKALVLEAGKTWQDAIDEVREAVDFLRYYAILARKTLHEELLPGPTGESNELVFVGMGLALCISPWNFPVAIFLGQIAAALVAGNAVIAKPANQTVILATMAVDILYRAGVPKDVLQLIPCDRDVANCMVADERIKLVMLTGSTATSHHIQRTLSQREGAITPLVAETGGQNVMVVDSSALSEQVVKDVIASAFQSAGQRCSACRVLYLQDEIADKVIEMLIGALDYLEVGDPRDYNTQVGPIIDEAACARLNEHVAYLQTVGKCVYEMPARHKNGHGTFFMPVVYEIDSIRVLKEEVFGPILHIVRFSRANLQGVIDDINATGYGLTLGVHSRISSFVERIISSTRAGNNYVNRNMIGATVGVQPFGGMGLSGTGPKAGGARYLYRLCKEKTITINTAAIGGNTTLMTQA